MLNSINPRIHISSRCGYPFRMLVLTIALFAFQSESFAQQGTLTDNATFPTSISALTVQGSSAAEGSAVSFIKFKLTPNLPPATPGGFVAKATLTLYVGSLNTSGSFNVYRVTSPWAEADTTAPTYDGANPVVIGVEVTAAGSYVTVDLTALAQQWLGTDGLGTGGVPNYGIALVANTATTAFSFDSKESTTTSHPARLAVVLNHVATADTATDFTGTLAGDVTGTQNATVVSSVGSQSAASVANSTIAANSATNTNTPGTIVKRDASGNFSAGTITGDITGNAATATNATNATTADVAKSLNRAAQDAEIVSPADGQIYYNTTSNVFRVFDGATSTWKIIDAGTATTLSSSATISGNQVNGELTNATVAGNRVTGEVANAATATTAVTANALSSGATVTGAQVSGDIPGNAASITGTITGNQVSSAVAEATHATNADNADNATTAGNASAVTNGVYTVGDQTVEGNKTFTSPIVGSITGNAATATNATNATNANVAKSLNRAAQDADIVSPADGQVYYNTTSNVFKVFDGATSNWKIVDAGNAATLSSSATINGNQVNGELTNATIAGYVTKVGDTMTGTLNLPGNGLRVGTNQLVLSAGNVGIGTTTPTFKLEVADTSSVAGRTIGINGTPIAYFPDYTPFFGSMAFGNGLRSLSHTTAVEGQYNTAVGVDALLANTTGWFNTAIGYGAMTANTKGVYSVAVGQGALHHNTTGISNTAVGVSALYNNTTANYNVAIGLDALQFNQTGTENTAVGKRANWQATSGNYNVIVGTDAMYSNLTGGTNTALGHNALNANLASNNVAVGASALVSNTTGTENAAFGRAALLNITTANNNTAVGNLAGRYQADISTPLTAATNSVYVGYQASGFNNADFNSIVIGATARGLGANTVVLGNDGIVTTALKGKVGIGTTAPAESLEVAGNLKLSGAGNGLIFPDGTTQTTASTFSSSSTINGNQVNGELTNATIAGNRVSGEVTNATNATNATTASNASAVTNGVYTVGDQTIEGNKTFTSPIVGNITGNAATATNSTNATNASVAKSLNKAAQDADIALPTDGQVYYNTTSNVLKVFDGATATWKIVDAGNTVTPGGTITGVTAGAGLSGGGTSGNVTLNVNQGVVAFQSDLASEVSTRQSADATLQNNINDEAGDRISADAALQTTADGKVAKAGDTMSGTLNLPTNGLVVGGTQLVLSGSKVGIGTDTPQTKLQINGGSVYVGSAGEGIILRSPNGLVCKQLTIDNTGAMVLSALTCP